MVKEAIHFILVESLQGKSYDAEHIQEWTQSIADTIKNKLKGNDVHFYLRCTPGCMYVLEINNRSQNSIIAATL